MENHRSIMLIIRLSEVLHEKKPYGQNHSARVHYQLDSNLTQLSRAFYEAESYSCLSDILSSRLMTPHTQMLLSWECSRNAPLVNPIQLDKVFKVQSNNNIRDPAHI